jgi:hypothetical protein
MGNNTQLDLEDNRARYDVGTTKATALVQQRGFERLMAGSGSWSASS